MNTLRTIALMTILTLLLLIAGGALGGPAGALFALALAALLNFASYWFSDKIVIAMYNGQPVTAGPLFEVVEELCRRNALPLPRIFLLPGETPNAFATGRNPRHAAVAATSGLVRMLSREELTGVMAHEMSHVGNRDILIGSLAATLAGAITYLAHMAQWAALFGGGRHDDEEGSNPLALIAMIIFAPLAAMLVQMAISRSREYVADQGGARLCGNPLWLSSALRKLESANRHAPLPQINEATAHMFIVNPLRGGGLLSLFSTHPPMAERIRRLEQHTVTTP